MAAGDRKSAAAIAAGKLFEQRFAAWLDARAERERHACGTPTGTGAEAERYAARHDELTETLEDAARLAMTTTAPYPWMVWRKFELLELALCEAGDDAGFADRRHIWMLAGIKADLLALGIGEDAAVAS